MALTSPAAALDQLPRQHRRLLRTFRQYSAAKACLARRGVPDPDAVATVADLRHLLDQARHDLAAVESLAAEARIAWPVRDGAA